MNKKYNMDNMNNMDMPNMPQYGEQYMYMYPEVYHKLAPHCDRIIKEMENNRYGNINLNEEMLNQMSDEAVRRSGLDNNTMEFDEPCDDPPAVQTIRGFDGHRGFNGGRGRNFRYDYYGVPDIARILLLQQIFGYRRPFWVWG